MADVPSTPRRVLKPAPTFGLDRTFHAFPFQRSTSVRPGSDPFTELPTAHARAGETADTPFR